ncbi:MAG: arsenate reductase ArsC [Candidatus Margulisiibacteriota bacterium]
MKKEKVLFVCVYNSVRSQMAEGLLNHLGKDRFEAESAGLEPGILSPLAVEAMKEIGIEISNNKTKNVLDFLKIGDKYGHIITVCDAATAEECPIFPGTAKKIHWNFRDPSSMDSVRKVRDEIKAKIEEFIKKQSKKEGS